MALPEPEVLATMSTSVSEYPVGQAASFHLLLDYTPDTTGREIWLIPTCLNLDSIMWSVVSAKNDTFLGGAGTVYKYQVATNYAAISEVYRTNLYFLPNSDDTVTPPVVNYFNDRKAEWSINNNRWASRTKYRNISVYVPLGAELVYRSVFATQKALGELV